MYLNFSLHVGRFEHNSANPQIIVNHFSFYVHNSGNKLSFFICFNQLLGFISFSGWPFLNLILQSNGVSIIFDDSLSFWQKTGLKISCTTLTLFWKELVELRALEDRFTRTLQSVPSSSPAWRAPGSAPSEWWYRKLCGYLRSPTLPRWFQR